MGSPHAASWLSGVPSPGLNLHLESAEFQTAIKWWLGIDLFRGEKCPFCHTLSLDPLGHHALTCRYNGDVVSRHNRVWDVFFFSLVGKLVLVAKWKLEVVWDVMPDVKAS